MYSHVACLLFVCLFKGAWSCLSQNIDVEGTPLYFSLRRVAGLWEDGRGEMVCAMTVDEALKMGMTLSDARKVAFATAKTLEGALEVAWKCMPEILKLKKYYYQHYTTLPYLMETILSGRWYLTKSASPRLNDQQELKKFGDAKLAEKTYQLSFCKGVRESAALSVLRLKIILSTIRICRGLE